MMIYTIPLLEGQAIKAEKNLRRIELYLSALGIATGTIALDQTTLLVEADKDPRPALASYASSPTKEEQALSIGAAAVASIRSRPANQWTDAERLALALWALVIAREG